jgi:hypothetical protein
MTTDRALEVPNRLVRHVLEQASFLISLNVPDAADAANMLAVAQILALSGIDSLCSEALLVFSAIVLVLSEHSSRSRLAMQKPLQI